MNEHQKRTMLIVFNDGSQKLLEFLAPVADSDANLAERLKELLDARHLVVEADGALFVIPMENVKYLQSFPAPKKLPANTLRGATFRD